jgi:hypothetical protein
LLALILFVARSLIVALVKDDGQEHQSGSFSRLESSS